MTEADWLTYTDPTPMVDYLRGHAGGHRLPLFALACCQRSRDLLAGSIRVPEQAADRLVREADRLAEEAERQVGWAALSESDPLNDGDQIAFTALCALSLPLSVVLQSVRVNAIVEAQAAEKAALCCLLRDIIGNPFVPLTVERAWLTPKVVRLARAIFKQRAFDRLPKLADALEDAGCGNFTILAHCRGCGPHVRGCWVVDLLRGQR
jgi:hypothetical protein